MNLANAETLARSLIAEHAPDGYGFGWDRATQRFGQCRYDQRVITLSRVLTPMRDDDAVRQTVLHEIAHALTPGTGHGWEWKAQAYRLGVRRPTARHAEPNVKVPARIIGQCQRCGVRIERQRVPKRKMMHSADHGEITWSRV